MQKTDTAVEHNDYNTPQLCKILETGMVWGNN